MTDASQVRRDALIRQLHDLGRIYESEVSVTVMESGIGTHMAIVEFHDPEIREVVIAEASTNEEDGSVLIDEVTIPAEGLEAVAHAILRAMAKDVGPSG
jgi:hypothetical protein